MPTPIVPKTNASLANLGAPPASSMVVGEIATNAVTGTLYMKRSNGSVVAIGDGSAASRFVQGTATGNGSQTVFALPATPANQSDALVFLGGVAQLSGTDFTITGSTLTFSSPPPSGITVVFLVPQAGTNLVNSFPYLLIL